MTARAVLRLTGVVKAFPGVVALKGVSLEIVEGEVHALLGENGAGKSTLMAIAAGAMAPDSGSVEIGGVALSAAQPGLAQSLGISVVYQHTSVLDELTVAENLGASIFGGRGSFLGALAGVLLVQEITSATGFLGLGSAWQYWLPGLLILLAAALYSRTRVAASTQHA